MRKVEYSILKESCDKESRKLSYVELLSTKEWFNKREGIIDRDRCCSICNFIETNTFADKNGNWAHLELKPIYGPRLSESSFGPFATINPINYEIKHSEHQRWFHVHHKYYILTKLPWEYDDNVLTTMCNWCHNEWHQNNEAPVFNEIDNTLFKCNLTICDRCSGAGVFPEYRHIKNGICFKCLGYKYLENIGQHLI